MADCYAKREARCELVASQRPACIQTRKEEVKSCIKEEDQGYQTCSEKRDNGYSKCNNWKIFKRLCKAWVWISNILCVAWTWIKKIVCVAWQVFTFVFCVLWAVILEYLCLALTWVIYFVCRVPIFFRNLVLSGRGRLFAFFQCLRPGNKPRNDLEKPEWTLVFEDDFAGNAVDPSKWEDTTWWGKPYFDDPAKTPAMHFTPGNYVVGAGMVRLAASNSPVTINDAIYNGKVSVPYSVAWLEWPKQHRRIRGYFEIRCKVPGTPDMFPAFWLASDKAWPPEIDIFEFATGDTSSFISTLHWGTKDRHRMNAMRHWVCKAADYFHIYACEWSETEVRWYYDNLLVRVETDGVSEFVHPMMVIINSAVDTGTKANPANSAYPNYFEIDYVRAYAR